MKAVDTNVIVRLVASDDARRLNEAALIVDGVFVSQRALKAVGAKKA